MSWSYWLFLDHKSIRRWRIEREALTSSKLQSMCVRSEFLWKLGSCRGYVKGIMREWRKAKGLAERELAIAVSKQEKLPDCAFDLVTMWLWVSSATLSPTISMLHHAPDQMKELGSISHSGLCRLLLPLECSPAPPTISGSTQEIKC